MTSCCSAISSIQPTARILSRISPRAPPAARLCISLRRTIPPIPKRLAEAAAAIVRLASALGKQIAEAGTFEHNIVKDEPRLGGAMTEEMLFATPVASKAGAVSPLLKVYNTIDKPLVPVLLRMEQTGVRIDSAVLGEMSDSSCC